MPLNSSELPAAPTLDEVWWVAVEGTPDPSGGWLVLADPGERGAKKIASHFAQAEVSILAAISGADLQHAVDHAGATVLWGVHENRLVGVSSNDSEAQALVEFRLENPEDLVVLSQSTHAPRDLMRRMHQIADKKNFSDVKLDFRSAPRGQGAWGLSLARALG